MVDDSGDLIATLRKICHLRAVQDWRMFEFTQGAKTAFCKDILRLCAPPAMKGPLRLVCHVLVDSVIVGYSAAPELTVILRLVNKWVQLLFDI